MSLRSRNIERLKNTTFDVLIVGGGINGAVSAAALSARGAKVGLIDGRDFAGYTSQHSSNLVWGGIKYMEGYEFGLVSGLCESRNELMRSYPSTVKEIRFLTTVPRAFRFHRLVLWSGAWLYWLIGRGFTKPPRLLSTAQIAREEPVVNVDHSRGGIEYSDAYLHDNDARFVFNFVRSAMATGCAAANYVVSLGASQSNGGQWITRVEDLDSGDRFDIRSKVLINAAGAFVDQHNQLTSIQTKHRHILSKGVHLIVPRVTKNKRVLAFFAEDGRLFFAIPMADRTCIGTTDTRVSDPNVQVTDEDRNFVLSNINTRLKLASPLTKKDIIAERCGVRPLVSDNNTDTAADFLKLSRKHVIEASNDKYHISIFGGKLTDCLNVGNQICNRVDKMGVSLNFNKGKWYGESSSELYDAFLSRASKYSLNKKTSKINGETIVQRLWRRYGQDANSMLDEIDHDADKLNLAMSGTDLLKCEINYLASQEMIVNLEDFLRRRSKMELVIKRDRLRTSNELHTVCESLFGDQAEQKIKEYFAE